MQRNQLKTNEIAFMKFDLHRDEFVKMYGSKYKLPAIFVFENKALKQVVSASDIKNSGDVFHLKELIKNKLGESK